MWELGFWFKHRWIGGVSAEILVNTRFADVSSFRVIGFFVFLSYGGIDYCEYFGNYVYFSPYKINIRILGLKACLSTSFWLTDRWAWLAHAPQMYCFLLVLYILSLFEVPYYLYSLRLGWVFFMDVTHEQAC